ncbi:hypothetical protein V5N11_012987 [Cardamine amara subsp. amara]|uniref:DUF8204 domain-containing protein n=1 Tax=Cardamine amara subsp. amara TaxID=228776 RepID=A0ABD0ZZD5_CARAN
MNEGSSSSEEEVTRTVMEEQRGSVEKVRSCKGYLYYSSIPKINDAKNPRCLGFPRDLRKVPDFVVRPSQARAFKGDFYYGCLGYSLLITTQKDSSPNNQHTTNTQIPVCLGLKITAGDIVDRRVASANTSSVPARVQNTNATPNQHQNHKPAPATSTNTQNGFITRFTRNANLVASGVMKNMKRVGNYAKKTMDDALDTYRKRPK